MVMGGHGLPHQGPATVRLSGSRLPAAQQGPRGAPAGPCPIRRFAPPPAEPGGPPAYGLLPRVLVSQLEVRGAGAGAGAGGAQRRGSQRPPVAADPRPRPSPTFLYAARLRASGKVRGRRLPIRWLSYRLGRLIDTDRSWGVSRVASGHVSFGRRIDVNWLQGASRWQWVARAPKACLRHAVSQGRPPAAPICRRAKRRWARCRRPPRPWCGATPPAFPPLIRPLCGRPR
jgi:hypothetical protein